MRIIVTNGFCVLGAEIRRADLTIADGRIAAVGDAVGIPDVTVDAAGGFVAPGFIDIHVHGGGGRDFMEASVEAFVAASEYHLRHGATSQVPTAVSAPLADLVRFLDAYQAAEASGKLAARLVGAHLEGPYLSMKKAGAHDPAFLKDPDPAEYVLLVERYPFLRRMTAAPELPGAFALGDYLHAHGVNASIGHSDASATTVFAAAAHGFTSVTHLYNAMSAVGERDGRKQGGVAEAALLDDRLYAEVIADLRHVPEELLRLAYRNKGKERLILVSDCLSPAGMETGRYRLGSQSAGIDVDVREAAFVAGTGRLAGSIAAADTLLRNMMSIGVPLADAVWMLTKAPAELLGIDDTVGTLAPGMAGDAVVFDASGTITHVIAKGRVIR